jgi:Zn ribbon nucleic-acid-binding protein
VSAFTYVNPSVPDGYKCATCGAHGVKLWREYQTSFAGLECAACACASQKKENNVDASGRRLTADGYRTDQIGWRVPAVPLEEGGGWWGYSSVPEAGVAWWRALPVSIAKLEAP